ncbi:MAG: carbamoyltransferase HypF [Glaciecola sp.]|jgi:hydrogenase maturation protein HypF
MISLKQKETTKKDALAYKAFLITGIVQGVGFRPTVWRYAKENGIRGRVYNSQQGVIIECLGSAHSIEQFIDKVVACPPPLAIIDKVTRAKPSANSHYEQFDISPSEGFDESAEAFDASNTHINIHLKSQNSIGADTKTCKACIDDVKSSNNRRTNYAFTNCTHCGPRLSIAHKSPYDRNNTTMADFNQCKTCLQEYYSPSDRRFHAQPNACPECGPQLKLYDVVANTIDCDNPILAAAQAIKNGKIVAIKALGGFQLAADARNIKVIERLRQLKKRPLKPFAIMLKNAEQVASYVYMNENEKTLLESPAGPIVLMRKRLLGQNLQGVASNQQSLGVMLPTTALHQLLLDELGFPVVMTSANAKGQPMPISTENAMTQLDGITDLVLTHNRGIVQRIDDSVARVYQNKTQVLRRARGYAPQSIALPPGFEQTPNIIAVGADLKNTACLFNQTGAVLTQHMGDLQDPSNIAAYENALVQYQGFLHFTPNLISHDQHPEYQSTLIAQNLAYEHGCQLDSVQHHHAHIASCMAENALALDTKDVLGIALDGLGFANTSSHCDDSQSHQQAEHAIWGGELLLVNYLSSTRLGGLKAMPLLGGDLANQQPWRNTLAYLLDIDEWEAISDQYQDLAAIKRMNTQPALNLARMNTLAKQDAAKVNAPLSSSCGRLFDAVAYLCGAFTDYEISFEGQASMALEAAICKEEWKSQNAYSFVIVERGNSRQIESEAVFLAILNDLNQGVSVGKISARFHRGLAQVLASICIKFATSLHINKVALSGGVFTNLYLLRAVQRYLENAQLQVLTHSKIPCNDGGISLGQAVVTAARAIKNIQGAH